MNKKHKKKLKRAAKKKKDKSAALAAQDNLTKKMNMFDRLPGKCSACAEPFPKTREAHMSWRVVVRHAEETVRLFCPACQEKAKEFVENNNEV
ncbi:MAG TPA: hypothetical protein DEQ32_09795 [Gammaproteobacteria bacterium]|nr:hypothetical protein [Gammaproteobacteria bacterium]